MKFSIGDKVKLLNEKGTGSITKILNHTTVIVMVDDGFEIPYQEKELIFAEFTSNSEKKLNNQIQDKKSNSIVDTSEISYQDTEASQKNSKIFSSSSKIGVYLLIVPQDQLYFLTGNIDIYLVNNTKQDFVFTFFKQGTNNYEGVDYDMLSNKEKILIHSSSREEISSWLKGSVHILSYGNYTSIPQPIVADYYVRPERFNNQLTWSYNDIIQQHSLSILLYEPLQKKESEKQNITKGDETNANFIETSQNGESTTLLSKFMINNSSAEIDLHIEKITEDYEKMSDHQKLDFQLKYFEKILDEAFLIKLQRLIAIHGVGKGSLKDELCKTLNKIEGVHYFDASYTKYGKGATEIWLKHI